MHHIALSRAEIERVQKIIARLDAQTPGAGADQRVHPRIDYCHPMWLHLPTDAAKPWIYVYSRNLSTGGLSFLSRAIFYAGQHLIISHELNEGYPHLVLARVRFCRSVEMGIYEAGLTFVKAQPDPQRSRTVPAEWFSLALEHDYLARQKYRAPLPR